MMKTLIHSLLTCLLAAGAAISFAAEPTAAEKMSAYAHERKAEAVAEGKRLIAETDKKIAEMKKQTLHSSAEAKAAHQANMKELRQKKRQAGVQLARLQRSSVETWEATKEGFANAYQAMRASFDKAVGSASDTK